MDHCTRELLNLTDKNFIPEENWLEIQYENRKNVYFIKGTWVMPDCRCSKCHGKNIIKHTPTPRKILMPRHNECKTWLVLNLQRYRCKDCGQVMAARCPLVDYSKNISKDVVFNMILSLKEVTSRKKIAKDFGVSDKTLERVLQKFKPSVMQNYQSLPRVLCLDEFRGVTTNGSKMNFICLDGETHQLVDILPNRSLKQLEMFFFKFSLSVRKRVKYLVMDMNAHYGELVRRVFPNAIVVVDRFHIVQHINRNFNQLRTKIMKQFPRDSKEHKNLKRYWKLLLKKYEKLDDQKVRYNYHFREYLTQTQLLERLLSFDETLEEAYWYLQDLRKAFDDRDYQSFMDLINGISNTLPFEFRAKFKVFKKFDKGIKEAFRLPYSNGPIEGVNHKIKVIKRIAYGYRNFDNMKARIKISTHVYFR